MESRNGKRNSTKEKSREDKNPAICKSPKKTVARQLDLDMPSSGEKGETISSPETFVQEPRAPKTLEKSHVASLLDSTNHYFNVFLSTYLQLKVEEEAKKLPRMHSYVLGGSYSRLTNLVEM